MTERRKGPTPLGQELQRYLERSGLAERVEEATVLPEWGDRVGAAIAGVTEPVRVSRGVLFVAVRSSVWLMELKLMEAEILQRLNAGRERGKIKKIRFLMAQDPGT